RLAWTATQDLPGALMIDSAEADGRAPKRKDEGEPAAKGGSARQALPDCSPRHPQGQGRAPRLASPERTVTLGPAVANRPYGPSLQAAERSAGGLRRLPPRPLRGRGYHGRRVVKQVLLASPRGYCAGVERAIETVEQALELHGAPVYVRKQIVHNAHVVRELEERGAVFVETEGDVP